MAALRSPALSAPVTANPLPQHDQLRRFLYPSLSSTATLPLLLPLSKEQQKDAVWIKVDRECQSILIQTLRIAILPWYSKLTNDRELFEEVVKVLEYGLRNVKEALLQRTGNITRAERFLLYDITSILQLHYVEVRRALAMTAHQTKEEGAAAAIYLASNPHPALSLDSQSHLQIDEAHIDVLLLAILEAVLPPSHYQSHNEVLIIMDVVKGLVRGQLRINGSGVWVLVRALSRMMDMQSSPDHLNSPSTSPNPSKWYDRANLLLGLHFVSAVLKTLFLYIAVVYLDLFTPLAEPKRRSRRRKGAEAGTAIGWDLCPVLDVIVQALEWRNRSMTRFLEEWIRIGLAWGGNQLAERQVKEIRSQWTRPEILLEQIARLQSILVNLPNQPPPEAAQEPSITVQKEELGALVSKMFSKFQTYPPLALLLGHDESMQKRTIERALFPFLVPPMDSSCCSVTEVADARTFIILLERIALLVNPTLE